MPREIRFTFPLKFGLHARPASRLQEVARQFGSDVKLSDARTGKTVDAKSVLSLVGADVREGDACALLIHGHDEDGAHRELDQFVRDELPHADDEAPPAAVAEDAKALPRSLTALGLTRFLRGIGASPGIGIGRVVMFSGISWTDAQGDPPPLPPEEELANFEQARYALRQKLDQRIANTTGAAAGVLHAHRSMLDDTALTERVREAINRQNQSAVQALRSNGSAFLAMLQNSASPLIRERAMDLQDVLAELLATLQGNKDANSQRAITLTEPSIIVTDRLTPGEFLAVDRSLIRGIVLADAGSTSHTVILARSMGVPMVVGVVSASAQLAASEAAVVDADLGLVIPQATDAVRAHYRQRIQVIESRRQRLQQRSGLPAQTVDGYRVEIAGIVSSAEEVAIATENGADGIGLFRTEMLYINRNAAPSEDEQSQIYAHAARSANGKPILIRLFDIGGDKPTAYLKLPGEDNPFLGYRGVRIYSKFQDLLRAQLRAVLRASSEGNVRVMVPMVSHIDEPRGVRDLLEQEAKHLSCATVPLGIMIEVPSCAFAIDELSTAADFFSIGSNDLIQYFLAADRGNAQVASLYSWTHPSFLRLLDQVVAGAKRNNKWIGLCGQMGEDELALPILLALGLDEISVPPPRVSAVREAVRKSSHGRCRELFGQALRCTARNQVESLLRAHVRETSKAPLLADELILQSTSRTKHEVIREMADALWLADRADDAGDLEEAIWKREDTYSTGFGFGFAMPHCKTDHVMANSIVIAKVASPIEWGSTDHKPVDVVILLALREADYGKEHMRVFAQLSRLVMRDEFRDRIRQTADRRELVEFLTKSLGLSGAVDEKVV